MYGFLILTVGKSVQRVKGVLGEVKANTSEGEEFFLVGTIWEAMRRIRKETSFTDTYYVF